MTHSTASPDPIFFPPAVRAVPGWLTSVLTVAVLAALAGPAVGQPADPYREGGPARSAYGSGGAYAAQPRTQGAPIQQYGGYAGEQPLVEAGPRYAGQSAIRRDNAVSRANFGDGVSGGEQEPLTQLAVKQMIAYAETNLAAGPDRTKALEHLNAALRWLGHAEDARTQATGILDEIQRAPETRLQTQQALTQPLPDPQPQVPAGAGQAVIQQGLESARGQLKDAQTTLSQYQQSTDPAVRENRKQDLQRQRAFAQQKLDDTRNDLQQVSGYLAEYRRVELMALESALVEKVALCDAELKGLDALAGLFPLLAQEAQQQVNWHQRHVTAWEALARGAESNSQWSTARRTPLPATDPRTMPATGTHGSHGTHADLLEAERQQRIRRQIQIAESELQRVPKQLNPLAERNLQLLGARGKLLDKVGETAGYLGVVQHDLPLMVSDFAKVRDKVAAGMTPAVGLLLRNRRDHLPNERFHQQRIRFCNAEMQRVQMELLDLEEERSRLIDLDAATRRVLIELKLADDSQPAAAAGRDAPATAETPRSLGPAIVGGGSWELEARRLLEQRLGLLDLLTSEYDAYHEKLSDLEGATRELLERRAEYCTFIDRNVLWIRSEQPINERHLSKAWDALSSLTEFALWSEVVSHTLQNSMLQPGPIGLLLLIGFTLLATRQFTKERLRRLGERVEEAETPAFGPTFEAFLLTLVLSLLWPLSIWGLGWTMNLNPASSLLTLALGKALMLTASTFFGCELLRHVCRRNGLAEMHFQWRHAITRRFYGGLVWSMVVGLPTLFGVAVTQYYNGGEWMDSLGRVAFIGGLLILALLIQSMLLPKRGVLQEALSSSRLPWLPRLRYVWYVVGVATPVVFAVMAGVGYSYTAHQLLVGLKQTCWLILAVFFGYSLVSLGLDILCKRLADRPLQAGTHPRQRAADLEAAEESRQLALEAADRQIQQFLRACIWCSFLIGGWLIWSDMIPIARTLDQVVVWKAERTEVALPLPLPAGEPKPLAAGATAAADPPVVATVPADVTLADCLLAALVVGLTLISVHTLPGILELIFLQRLPIDRGARHAIVILSRYAVTLLGIIIAARCVGISWSNVQWLAAAMMVGLGFGLQDIFGNLISGLIILFERPIRIGDYVTVGEIYGKVTHVQLRATTITDLDNRELVVPNKKFIANEVINWTLSDPVTRFIAEVGISHDADPAVAQELLLRIARENPLVLKQPEPTAALVAIGERGLDLELRGYLADREQYATVLNQVNLAIEEEFRKHGVDIARPVREIKLRNPEEFGFDRSRRGAA